MTFDYESDKVLADYLVMHYGEHDQRMPWSIGRVAALDFPNVTANYFSQKRVALSLDLGCAVGGSCFHLSKTSEKVIGVDLSEKFINAASELKSQGELAYQYQEEGNILSDAVARIPTGAHPERISFAVGDVLDLPKGFKDFDRVHASNLLCRVPKPAKLIKKLSKLVKKDGELVLATPFSWLEEYTPKENWPEGDSWAWLQEQLSDDFVCLRHADEIFTIREHARKFQLGVSKVSHWRKK